MKVAIFVLYVASVALASPVDWRIIGGEKAVDGQFPYQVSLHGNGRHFCGGSILDETTILCAAHCLAGSTPSSMTVRVGNNKLSEQTEEYKVSKLIAHEKFNASTFSNDISIIKLAQPIQFRDGAVEAVKLRQSNVGDSDAALLSGWGSTVLGGSAPNDLQFIHLKTVPVKQCAEAHIPTGLPVFDTEVCTLTKAGEGACHGDSGGPLVDSNTEQIGIVSWGSPCARGLPDVFTRVYSYLNWIEENRY